VVVPNAMLGMVTRIAPSAPATRRRRADPAAAAHPLLALVRRPPAVADADRHAVLGDAPPAKKASVLDALRKNVSAVNDWAVGRRGPERAFIATSALGYVLPFAVGWRPWPWSRPAPRPCCSCSAWAAVRPALAVAGRRQRRALVRFWLAPLLGSLAVLAAASLLSFVVVRAAETLHASDEYVGLLLAGSTWPALAAFLIGRWLTRRRQGPGLPPAGPDPRRGTRRGADRMNAESTAFRASRPAVVLAPGGEGARAAAWLLAWPMRLAASPLGRRLLAAVASASSWWPPSGTCTTPPTRPVRPPGSVPAGLAAEARPAPTGGRGARRPRAPARGAPAGPAEVAAAWWAGPPEGRRRQGPVPPAARISATELQVLVWPRRGSRMPSEYVTVRKSPSGWKVP
jgi:hypothetical protein